MNHIAEHIQSLKEQLPSSVTLVAVSKYHSNEEILEAYHAGQRVFGENLVQELRSKQEALPKDIEWHFIGHLQTNKVKYIAPFVSMIHAVDSYKLLEEINRQSQKHNRIIPVLLQIHIAQEETKFGFSFSECDHLLKTCPWTTLQNIDIRGLMCIASNTDDTRQIQSEFHEMYSYFENIREQYFSQHPSFACRSWGMSDDYPLAIQEGSNMVRVGSLIFGVRDYSKKK